MLTQHPFINPNLCVHSKISNSSCRNCIDICPSNAWVISNESLAFDEKQCKYCNSCVGSCNEGAIYSDFEFKTLKIDKDKIVFLAINEEENPYYLKDLNILSIKNILKLSNLGVNEIILNGFENIESVKTNLSKISLVKSIKILENISLEETNTILNRYKQNFNRRELLKKTFTKIVKSKIDKNSDFALKNFQKEIKESIYRVNLDENSCTYCQVCTRLCPHNAISFETINNKKYFLSDSLNCTNCKLCSDICLSDSIKITLNNKEDKVDFKVELTDNICKSCYFDFVSNDKKEICPNCEKKRISN